jgi:formamidopyrimidine-DNA glycosylase
MPELPEVETVVRILRAGAIEARIVRVELLRRDIVQPPAAGARLGELLAGRRIDSITRRGKRIIVGLEPAACMIIHLGMTGRLTLHSPDAPRRPHTHLVLHFTGEVAQDAAAGAAGVLPKAGGAVGAAPKRARAGSAGKVPQAAFEIHFSDPRRFGGIRWLGQGEQADAGLGPEPLTISQATFAAQLARRHRPIKSALLDQQVIAGLGNIYVDESLFRAGIHPLRRADTLPPAELRKLRSAITRVLRQAIDHGGSTVRDYADAAGASGRFQNLHQVYGRAGQPCLECGAAIQRIVLGGRSTCFCPRCQSLR